MIPLFRRPERSGWSGCQPLGEGCILKSWPRSITSTRWFNCRSNRQSDRKGEQFRRFSAEQPRFFTSAKPDGSDDSAARPPRFSDVLVRADERKVTLLYDVAAGTNDPNSISEVPVIKNTDQLQVIITHVQLKAGPAKQWNASAFNQGPWLELVSTRRPAEPYVMAWQGIEPRSPSP